MPFVTMSMVDEDAVCFVAISKNGQSDESIINALRENESLYLLQHPECESNLRTFDSDEEAISGGLKNAIDTVALLSISHILPYNSINDRNKALFHPFMFILRSAVFSPCDAVYHLAECMYYLITLQISKAFFSFVKLLCDITAIIIHAAVNLPLSCTSIIIRNIFTALFDVKKRMGGGNDWFGHDPKQDSFVDKGLNYLVYNTANNVFFFHPVNTAEVYPMSQVVPVGDETGTDLSI